MAEEKNIKEYGIAFKGLKDGEHVFEYKLTDAFFGLFEAPQIETGELTATVKLLKSSRMLELEFTIEGMVGTICDRCLDKIDVPIAYQGTLYVNFGEFYDEPTEEIVVLPHDAHTINVARFMYEFIVVSLPIRHIHPDNDEGVPGCDRAMMERLDEYLVDERSGTEAPDDHSENEPIDPRWEELKKFKNKNNK